MPIKKNRARHKGRSNIGTFSAWPHTCANNPNFFKLSLKAKALLLHFIGQYKGFNNGDLDCSWTNLQRQGWKSRTTIESACAELEKTGWIVRTRQGHRNSCNLYAVTFRAIDECKGKLQVPPTMLPLAFWKLGNNPWLEKSREERPSNSFRTTKKWRKSPTIQSSQPTDETGAINE